MAEAGSIATTVAWWGFGLGLIFGFFANKTNFCTMGAVSDVVNIGDWGRMRAWFLAMAIAMIGTNILSYNETIDLAKTIYTTQRLPWLAHLVGGMIFGVGMTLASGCGNKTLVRVGGGNLKAVIVFIYMAYAARLTMGGVFAPFKGVLQHPAVTVQFEKSQTLPFLLGGMFGMEPHTAELVFALVIGGILLAFSLLNRDFWASKDNFIGGLVVGVIVVAGWYVTGKIGFAEDPDTLKVVVLGTNSQLAESMSFIAPSAYTVDFWAMWTDSATVITWGIATVFGVGIGSFFYAGMTNAFRWEHFISSQDMFRHIIGAVLMGFGGITAMGCTIGQGVTGLSTLSVGSFITLAGIIAGSAVFMKYEYWKMMQEA